MVKNRESAPVSPAGSSPGLSGAEFQALYKLQPLVPLPPQLAVLSHACLESGDYLVIFAQAPHLLFQVTARGVFMHEAAQEDYPELTFHRGSPFASLPRPPAPKPPETDSTLIGEAVTDVARPSPVGDLLRPGAMVPEHLRPFCAQRTVWRIVLDGVQYFADERFCIFARVGEVPDPIAQKARLWHPREGDEIPRELFDGDPEPTESGMWRIRVRGDTDNLYITDESFRLLYSVRRRAYQNLPPHDGDVLTLAPHESLEPPAPPREPAAERDVTPLTPLLARPSEAGRVQSGHAAPPPWMGAEEPPPPVSPPPEPPPAPELPPALLVFELMRLVRGDREDSGLLARHGITASFFRDTILQPGRKQLFARALAGDIDADLLGDKRPPTTDEKMVLRRQAGPTLLKAVLLHNLYINSVKSQRGDDLPEDRGKRMRGFIADLICWQQRPEPAAPRGDREPLLRHFQRLSMLSHFEPKKMMIERVYMQIEADPDYRGLARDKAPLLDLKTMLIYKLYSLTNISDRGNGVEMILLVREIMGYPKTG